MSVPLPAVQSGYVATLLLAFVMASRRVQEPSVVVLSALVSTRMLEVGAASPAACTGGVMDAMKNRISMKNAREMRFVVFIFTKSLVK